MTDREKLIELLDETFEKQYDKNLVITARSTADHLIANGVTFAKDTNAPSWIPVTERLPEEWQRVLVCLAYKAIAVGRIFGGYWVVSCNNDPALGVTHWMPLPEPPKEE